MAKSSTKAKQPAAKDDAADKPAAAKPAEQPKPAEKPKAAPKPKAAVKPKADPRRNGLPDVGETVHIHTPNPIDGRLVSPAKVLRHNDHGTTLALEVTLTTGVKKVFTGVGDVTLPGQQWWSWPDVDGAAASA